jgi:homoserine O-acetyltransferase/O-succinyltransferase
MRAMRARRATILGLAVIVLALGLATPGQAAEVTRLAGVEDLAALKKFYAVANFKIGGVYQFGNESAYEFGGTGGVTLESLGAGPLRLAYLDVGTPKRDADGRITNAVIISSYYSGDASFSYHFWYDGQPGTKVSQGAVVGPGKLIDTDKYYVIFLDALGLWGTSKPSGGLGLRFPQYSFMDMVQANYRLLRDKLNVGRVKLATGVSMGAIQSTVWAVLHPNYVEAIMPIGGIAANDPVVGWLFQLMTAAMQSDPVWRETRGHYYDLPKERHPNKGMMFGWSILGHTGLAFDTRIKQGLEAVQKEVFYWDPQGEQGVNLLSRARDYDVNDLLYRNQALVGFDIREQLPKVKAKTLILHVENDQWLRLVTAQEAAKKIPGAKLRAFDSPLAHYAVFQAPNVLRDDVLTFFKEIGM